MPIAHNAPKQERIFIKYKHLESGRIDDMPKKLWDRIQRDYTRRDQFEFIEEINLETTVPVASAGKLAEIPIIEDDLECPLCGYVAEDDAELETHKTNHY